MDLEKLLEQIKAISQILNNPSLRTSSSQNEGMEDLIKEFDLLVGKIELQHANSVVPKEELGLLLSELSEKIELVSKHCDINITKLDFIKNMKPLN